MKSALNRLLFERREYLERMKTMKLPRRACSSFIGVMLNGLSPAPCFVYSARIPAILKVQHHGVTRGRRPSESTTFDMLLAEEDDKTDC